MEAEDHSPRRLALTVSPAQDGSTVDALLRRTLGLSGTSVKRAKRVPGASGWTASRSLSPPGPAPAGAPVLVGDTGEDETLSHPRAPWTSAMRTRTFSSSHKAPGWRSTPARTTLTIRWVICGLLLQNVGADRPVFRPVLNRLDRGTSGLMCVAKHAHAHELLKEQLQHPAFRRVYLAVCEGCPPAERGVVDAPIGRAEDSLLRREVRPDGAPARTRYKVLSRGERRSLVRLELETGRTHQIRLHMAHLGCPLTGDFLYGREDPRLIPRPALHSWLLSLRHPITGDGLERTAPLPPDLLRLLEISSLTPSLEGPGRV